ncbi:unnamed protein product [Discula destructiva]
MYRHTPTGLIQFSFPKPGDEFPNYGTPGTGPFPFTAEESLAYVKQIQMRNSAMLKRGNPNAGNGTSKVRMEGGDILGMSATGYFDPEAFMSLGESENGADLTHPKNGFKE